MRNAKAIKVQASQVIKRRLKLFIAGRALYWQRDYQYAMRSFRDLELNFPDSEYFDRARLWRGRTLMALGQMPEARALFSELLRERSSVGDQAGLRQGELAASEGDRRGAITEYRRALEAFPESPLTSQMGHKSDNKSAFSIIKALYCFLILLMFKSSF